MVGTGGNACVLTQLAVSTRIIDNTMHAVDTPVSWRWHEGSQSVTADWIRTLAGYYTILYIITQRIAWHEGNQSVTGDWIPALARKTEGWHGETSENPGQALKDAWGAPTSAKIASGRARV